MSDFWGYHLILDCSGCNNSTKDKETIYQFVKQLINDIEMIAVGEPVIEYLSPTEENSGYSLMQMIMTSNITAHFVDSTQSAYIDVFSCKEFDNSVVIDLVKKYFSPKKIKTTFLTRHAE
jgi:S-adenosylmethionine/arginine decarboxylase-like enzyme